MSAVLFTRPGMVCVNSVLTFDELLLRLPWRPAHQLVGARVGSPAGLDVAVSEDASDRFIIAGLVSEPDRRGSMAKLMNGDEQAGGLFDPLRDLTAEGLGVLTARLESQRCI